MIEGLTLKFLLIFIFLLPQWVAAQSVGVCDPEAGEMRDIAASNRLRTLLKEQQFAAIEDEMSDKLSRYERGQYSDLAIFWDIDNAAVAEPELEPFLKAWLKAKPKSFFAHLFVGQYYSNLGYAKRGTKMISGTSSEQLDAMKTEHAKARTALQIAEKLRPQSALPIAGLIQIDKSFEGVDNTHKLLKRANQMDPKNTAARAAAIYALPPKWGGSIKALDGVVQQAEQAQLAEPKLRFLRYSVDMQKGDHFGYITKEKTKAIPYWRSATQLCTSTKPWGYIAAAAYDLENWPVVKEASDQTLRIRPRDESVIARRGWAQEQMGNMNAALIDYERASQLGSAWAQNRYGYFLLVGMHVPKDTVRAKKLFQESAAQGNQTARENLEAMGQQ